MPNYKPITALLISFCFNIAGYCYAQAPVITPKGNPVILHLDANGNYAVRVNDLANVINNTDSATRYRVNPKSFDCSNRGNNKVKLTAFTNGSASVYTPDAVGVKGPLGIAFDIAGNLFIAENTSCVIRKITPQGVVSNYAGAGVPGFKDGPAATAMFAAIIGIAADSLGNVYVCDSGNSRIRKIDINGNVTTLAGDGSQGNKDGQGQAASFNAPSGIAFDKQQNLYVTDEFNFNIRKVTLSGKVTTFAGSGVSGYYDGPAASAQFGKLKGIAIDSTGNVFVCDEANVVIRKITPQGIVSTYAGVPKNNTYTDGPKNSATFLAPLSIVLDQAGNLYVGDIFIVRKIGTDGIVSTLAGSATNGYADGQGSSAKFNSLAGIGIDLCGNIYVSDYENQRIRKVTLGGMVSTVAGNGFQVDINGNVGPSSCVSAIAQIPVDVQSTPTITSVFNDITVSNCTNLADYTTKATATDNCPNSVIKFTQSPAPGTVLINNTPVNVTITATDTTGGSSNLSFNVTAKDAGNVPQRSVTVTADNTVICQGTPVNFTANVVNADAGTTYQWIVNDMNTGPDNALFTTSSLNNGDVVNCIVTTSGGCSVPNSGSPVTITVNPVPAIDLNANEQILAGSSIVLKPQITGNIATYSWTPATGLSDAAIADPVASPEVTTTYQLKVISTAGCFATAPVTINVGQQINVPNVFTPNGDGINDLWNIKYLSNYPTCSVSVFNRYGLQIFHSVGYGKPWAGTYNNKKLPTGTYYYIIDLKDGSKPLSGSVTIIY
ncbi:gliding motility-associated C-terminal domain-containing protein [Mucilaginibacter sp.]|uniref:T9SS type B sorting domain-containing protein n=1 Tax=Mucilaginibacter sp. TaxID=1882438 RepID=UPI003D1531AF